MSRSSGIVPEGSTATGSTSSCPLEMTLSRQLRDRALAPRQQQRRPRQTPALERALPETVTTGRLPAEGASKRIAPGRGHSSAAVVLE